MACWGYAQLRQLATCGCDAEECAATIRLVHSDSHSSFHNYLDLGSESRGFCACQAERPGYGGHELQVFGFEVWEPRRVKPVGFTRFRACRFRSGRLSPQAPTETKCATSIGTPVAAVSRRSLTLSANSLPFRSGARSLAQIPNIRCAFPISAHRCVALANRNTIETRTSWFWHGSCFYSSSIHFNPTGVTNVHRAHQSSSPQ